MKQHLKTIAAPRTWPIKRKGIVWITRPKPGKHKLDNGISLNTLITKILQIARTAKEVRNIIFNKEVLVDGKKVKEPRQMVGLMDIISFPEIKESYRIVLDSKNKLKPVKVEDKNTTSKVCKVTGKKLQKNKIQLTLHDGRVLVTDNKDIKVNDTIVISLPKQDIKEHIKFEKGSLAYLTSGKHTGEIGPITDIKGNNIIVKSENTEFETLKKCIFIVGKDKPLINLG